MLSQAPVCIAETVVVDRNSTIPNDGNWPVLFFDATGKSRWSDGVRIMSRARVAIRQTVGRPFFSCEQRAGEEMARSLEAFDTTRIRARLFRLLCPRGHRLILAHTRGGDLQYRYSPHQFME